MTSENGSEHGLCYNLSQPFCGVYDAGRVLDAIFLTLLTVFGTIGNLMVIFSIILSRRVHKNGNVFIINLAVADLIVTGFFTPTVVANVVLTTNALPIGVCQAAGYLVTVSCVCSASNLACIAFNRYWAVARHTSYKSVFTKKRIYIAAVINWIWANLLIMPTFLGWTKLEYGPEMLLCSYNNVIAPSYNVFVMVLAISLPIGLTVFCYWRLFAAVKKRGAKMRRVSSLPATGQRNLEHRQLQKQINLAKTLAMAVLAFVVCWTPYGILIILSQNIVPPIVKRVASRLILTNSVINFVIYGVMNPTYRKGYKLLISYVCCCVTNVPGVKSEIDSHSTNGTHAKRFQSMFSRSNLQKPSPALSVSSNTRRTVLQVTPQLTPDGSRTNLTKSVD